jgi:hypothetical protein
VVRLLLRRVAIVPSGAATTASHTSPHTAIEIGEPNTIPETLPLPSGSPGADRYSGTAQSDTADQRRHLELVPAQHIAHQTEHDQQYTSSMLLLTL